MSKIARKTAILFGGSAGANQIAQFGSLAAASPSFSTDPAVIQSLSNWTVGWFSGVETGNSPAIEDMNAFCYVDSYQLAYIMQAGIAEWDSGTTYYIGSLCTGVSTGIIYVSLVNNNLNNLVSDAGSWAAYVPAKATALQTARNINGVAFDGTASITVTASASTLTGTSLTSTVVSSSLNSISSATTFTIATNAGTTAGSIDTSQKWTIGASGSTQMHQVNGQGFLISGPTSGDATVELDSLNTTTKAGYLTVAGNATTSSQYAYYESRNRQTATIRWFAGTLGSDAYAIGGGANVAPGAQTNYLTIAATSGAVTLTGTNTNDSAATGKVGEAPATRVTSFTNLPAATTLWGDMTSVSLTSGDWDVTGVVSFSANASTITSLQIGISITSGNSSTGLQEGDNMLFLVPPSTVNRGGDIPVYRISLASTTTVYFKVNATYTVATPQYVCRISARRPR